MAIVNGYCLLADYKTAVGISDTTDDTDIEQAIETASRQIDGIVGRGRKFWQDSTVVARTYYPSESNRVWVDDISTLTGLIVKVDQDDNGTFETTLTINTDFIVEPVNAAAEYPVRPYESIRLLNNALSSFPCLSSGRPSVQVTAKFGWSAVPDAIERACINQAKTVFKGVDAQNDTVLVSAEGFAVRLPAVSTMTRVTLEQFVRYSEVDDRAHN